jgi:hypothetical protein
VLNEKAVELETYRKVFLERYQDVIEDLAQTLGAMTVEQRDDPVGPEMYHAHALTAHIRDLEEHLFLPVIEGVLREDGTRAPDISADILFEAHYRCSEPLESILDSLREIRRLQINKLKNMAPDGWNRKAVHATWGARTLQWWVELSLAHIEEHLANLKSKREGPYAGI